MSTGPHQDAQHVGHGEGDAPRTVADGVRAAFDALDVPDHAHDDAWVTRGRPTGTAGPAIFLVHPTTHRSDTDWFGDPEDAGVRSAVEEVVTAQAAAFPGELWAPHYRAASTRAFAERDAGGEEAYDLAHRDVAAAFTQFLADESRAPGPRGPLVLVGHSQGARHVRQLLLDHVEHPGIAERLVAAYAIGIDLEVDDPVVALTPLAAGVDDVGVLVAYQAGVADAPAASVLRGLCVAPTALGSPEGVSRDGGVLLLSPERVGEWHTTALSDGRLHHAEVQVLADVLRADVARRTHAWHTARRDGSPHAVAPAAPTEVERWPGVVGRLVGVQRADGARLGYAHVVDLPSAARAADDATPLVLLHKLGGWVAEWREVATALAHGRRVVVLDLPGHGGSTREGNAPWVHWPDVSAAEVLDVLDQLGLDRFHLMGCSMGGVVGMHVAAAHPDRVVSLTVVATSATPALSARRTREIDDMVRPGFGPGWMPRPGQNARAGTSDPRIAEDQNASRARGGRWVRASERGVGLAGVEQLLSRITVPVLSLNGENAGYRSYDARVAELLADVTFEVVPDAGSFVHQERPADVVAAWERFVADVAARD
ncbi:alpha/beta fold hydrolase [Nocardioides yefusunii]|uniref:Alpha/beta fold hydrolase n=1 Tax=Nocardioides yefusunii TaxID=2500546 RepID=A0ABW1QW07_9ACTN|nr:alpha/beta fold hydrolase [Nocardioides yefusunii]